MSDEQSMQIMNWREYGAPSHIPFSMLCEEQAQRNHSQTLARLNERGGLSPKECLAVMDQLSPAQVSTALCSRTAARIITKRFLERYEIEQLRTAKENAVLQAQIWAQEARSQKAIVKEIYEAIGFEGGDWNGARPVIEKLAELTKDATRYKFLRARDLDTIKAGGVFAGLTPRNVVLNGEDLDQAVDSAMEPDDYPECSGDPDNCPENEGHGCCNREPQLKGPASGPDWDKNI